MEEDRELRRRTIVIHDGDKESPERLAWAAGWLNAHVTVLEKPTAVDSEACWLEATSQEAKLMAEYNMNQPNSYFWDTRPGHHGWPFKPGGAVMNAFEAGEAVIPGGVDKGWDRDHKAIGRNFAAAHDQHFDRADTTQNKFLLRIVRSLCDSAVDIIIYPPTGAPIRATIIIKGGMAYAFDAVFSTGPHTHGLPVHSQPQFTIIDTFRNGKQQQRPIPTIAQLRDYEDKRQAAEYRPPARPTGWPFDGPIGSIAPGSEKGHQRALVRAQRLALGDSEQADVSQLRADNRQLQASSSWQQAEISRLRASNSQLLAEHGQLQASNSRLLADISEQADISQLRASNSQLRTRVSRLQADNKRLRADNKRLLADITEQADNSQLQADNKRLRTDVSQLQADNSQLQADNKRLRTDVSQLQASNSQLHAVINQLRPQYSQLQAEYSRLPASNRQLQLLIANGRSLIASEEFRQANMRGF